MPIDAGDVVLTAVLDLGNLDQGLASIRTKVPGAFQGAAQGAQEFNDELDATGENAEFAGEKIRDAMSESRREMREAKGELGLFGELFGIHLPRHVRTFIAELPGVAPALSAAFAATAVIFIIEAIAKGIEKLKEWSEHAHQVELGQEAFQTAIQNSFNSLDEKLLQSGIKLDELRGNHVAALKKELELINLQKFDQLQGEFDKLAKAGDAMFTLLAGHWYLLDSGSTGAKNALVEFKAKYDLLLAEHKDKESGDLLAGTLQSARNTLTNMEAAKKQADELQVELAKTGHSAGLVGGPTENEIESQRVLIGILEAEGKQREKNTQLAKDEAKAATEKEAKREATEEAKLQKEIADAHIKAQKEIQQVMAQTAKMEADMAKQQKKDDDQARRDRLESLKQKEQGWIAEVDAEIAKEKEGVQQKELLIKAQYDAGKISGQQYLNELKTLYANDTAALIAMLEHKKQLVIAEATTEAAIRGKLLTAEDAKELKEVIQIEQQKAKVRSDAALRTAKAVDELAKHEMKAINLRPQWDKFFHDLISGSLRVGAAFRALANEIGLSIASSVAAAETGSEGFAQAMEKMLASALAEISGEAAYRALKELAYAASAAATPGGQIWVGPHLAAAAKWAALAGATGAAAGAMSGGGGGGGGGGGSGESGPTIDHSQAATHAAAQPVSVTNVPHLASGGLMMQDSYAMLHRGEVVMPLDNPSSAQAIREGLGGGCTHVIHVEGIPMHKLARRLSGDQKKGKIKIHSTSTGRTIRQF